MSGSRSTQSESAEEGRQSLDLIGAVVGVLEVPVFAYLGLELFGQPVFGAFVGLVIGLGTYLAFPAFVTDDDRRDAADDEAGDVPATPTSVSDRIRQFHRTAAGLTLPPAGILLFAWRFVNENLLLGTLATAVIALAIYLPLAVLLPQRLS